MSQLSDASMGDAPPMTDSQLDRDATELLAADPSNDRLEDALATAAVEQPGSMGPPAKNNPASMGPPAAGKTKAAKEDETGKCASSNGSSSGGEDDDDEEADAPAHLAGLMEAGGNLITRFASSQQSQMTDDGDDYEETQIREEFNKLKTSMWMQKKLDKTTNELEKLVKQHEASKRELVKPVKELIELYPEKKQALTLMSGLLSDACTDGDLRDAIVSAANVLKSQTKMVESIQDNMKIIEVGKICLDEKKAEEANKRDQSSTTMSAAAALLAGASSSKKPRKK